MASSAIVTAPSIRLALARDQDAVMAMLKRDHAEIGIVPLNEEKLTEHVADWIDRSDLFLVEVDGKLAGGMGLIEYAPYYSDGHILTDRFFYIEPEFRGGIALRLMLDLAKAEAERRAAPCFLSVFNHKRGRGRVSDILGFVPAGYHLMLKAAMTQALPPEPV